MACSNILPVLDLVNERQYMWPEISCLFVYITESMVPIPEENILFLGDADPVGNNNNKKGVTVSTLDSNNQVRVSIWSFVKKGTEGYITPRRGGISLTTTEFGSLKSNLAWINAQIRIQEEANVNKYIDSLETVEDIQTLKRRLADAEKNLAAAPTRPAKQIKRRTPASAAQGAP